MKIKGINKQNNIKRRIGQIDEIKKNEVWKSIFSEKRRENNEIQNNTQKKEKRNTLGYMKKTNCKEIRQGTNERIEEGRYTFKNKEKNNKTQNSLQRSKK